MLPVATWSTPTAASWKQNSDSLRLGPGAIGSMNAAETVIRPQLAVDTGMWSLVVATGLRQVIQAGLGDTALFSVTSSKHNRASAVRSIFFLIQSHMAQKPVLRGEVGCACVAREEVWASAGVQGAWVGGCGCEAD